jgi:cell division protein FtsQ
VVFAGDLDRLPQRDLEALTRAIQGGETTASLAEIREAALRVRWVRDARVRRQAPDTVEIHFEAHRALARWNEAQLVSVAGEVFTAEEAGALPRFRGPEGGAAQMAAEYPKLVAATATLGSPIAEVRLSPRGAWQVGLQSGLVLDLGRGDVVPRAQRFAEAWPQLAAQGTVLKVVDLRYPNGFAVKTTASLSPALAKDRERNRRPTLSPALPQGGGRTP